MSEEDGLYAGQRLVARRNEREIEKRKNEKPKLTKGAMLGKAIEALKADKAKHEEWASRLAQAFWDEDIDSLFRVIKEMAPDMVAEMQPMTEEEARKFKAQMAKLDAEAKSA